MSFRDLDIIREIIPSLTKAERRVLKKLISGVYNRSSSDSLYDLFSKVSDNSGAKDYFLSSDFSKNKRKQSDVTKKLLRLIQQSLLISLIESDSQPYSELYVNKFRLRILILSAEIFRSRGGIKSAVKVLDKCESIAHEFQLYDELIEILYIKSDISFSGSSYYQINEILVSIEQFELCRRRVKESLVIYRDYFSKIVKKGNYKGDKNILHDSINKLAKYHKETGSNKIKLYEYLFRMELALVTEDFNDGKKVGEEAIKLLHENINIRTKTRIGYFHFNIAELLIGSLEFNDSIAFAQIAKSYFIENSLNRIISSQFLTISSIYSELFLIGHQELNEVLNLPLLKSYPFYQSKFQYFQAILYFLQKRFDDGWRILSMHLELEKDKEGWRVWLSLVRILTQIERKEYVDVGFQIESFRKYIKRWEQRSEIRDRDKLVFKVIESLNRNNFDFKKVAGLERATLQSLAEADGEHKWRPNSPEMIIFHDWFNSKLKNIDYQPNFQPYRALQKN